MTQNAVLERREQATVVKLPGVEFRLTAEQALRAVIDNQVFAALRELEPLDGGRAVQSVYVALIRRLPNVIPDRKRIAIDCGYSESSVKRAIQLLERCRLIVVERKQGLSSVYHLADVRSVEVSSDCVAAIRKLVRSESTHSKEVGRVTCDPTSKVARVSSDPTGRVSSDPRVGSLVTHKETNKNQSKQQGVAVADGQNTLKQVLKRWGLMSASYLVERGHPKSIPELTKNPILAARLIDVTMQKVSWSAEAGVGSRVAFLREHVGDAQDI